MVRAVTDKMDKEDYWKCSFCGGVFSSDNLDRHLRCCHRLSTEDGMLLGLKSAQKVKGPSTTFKAYLRSLVSSNNMEEKNDRLEKTFENKNEEEAKDNKCKMSKSVDCSSDDPPTESNNLDTISQIGECYEKDDSLEDNFSSEFDFAQKVFKNYPEFQSWFTTYCSKTNTIPTKRSSRRCKRKDFDNSEFEFQNVQFKCSHGIPRQSRGKNIRTKQSVLNTDCPFTLNLGLCVTKRCYHITSFVQQHSGHETTSSAYDLHPRNRALKYDSSTKKYVEMMNAGVKKNTVQNMVKKDLGKEVTTKDLQNLMRKSVNYSEADDMQETLEKLENSYRKDELAYLNISHDENKEIRCIFYQSGKQRELFQRFGTVLFVDGTYRLTDRGYILVPFVIIDGHGNSCLVAWSLISSEEKHVLMEALSCFKEANKDSIPILQFVIVDKDFTEINCLFAVFPHTHFIICSWHASRAVLKYSRRMILSSEEQHYKQRVKILFDQMMHAPSETLYFETWSRLCSLSTINPTLSMCVSYIEENWHRHRDHWARYSLNKKELYNSFTNNRSEAFNKNMKQICPIHTRVPKVIQILLNYEQQQKFTCKLKTWKDINKTKVVISIDDPITDEILRVAREIVTGPKVDDILLQAKLMSQVNRGEVCMEKGQVKCPRLQGECKFNLQNHLPCKHLLFVRKQNGESLVEATMMGKRWMKQAICDVVDPPLCYQDEPVLKKVKKGDSVQANIFQKATKLTKNIPQVVSQSSHAHAQHTLDVLGEVTNMLEKGEHVSIDDNVIYHSGAGKTEKVEKVGNNVFKFQPHAVNKKAKSKITDWLSKGKKQETSKDSSSLKHKEELTEINKYIIAIGVPEEWESKDIDVLKDDSLKGFEAYLTDKHMTVFHAMLKKKFPHIKGFEHTTVYQNVGLSSIAPEDEFIQIVHAGSNHWAVLTNIGINEIEREKTVKLYDSFVSLSRNSNNNVQIPPAIVWQACQLLRKPYVHSQPESTIYVKVMSCPQQENGWDCGPLALANAIALAHGLLPENLSYTGAVRKQLLQMLVTREIEPCSFTSVDKHCTKARIGRIDSMISVPQVTQCFTSICDCQMPESYDNVILCVHCKRFFHQACYLLGHSNKITSHINFVCYSCRTPGRYDFMLERALPDNAAISAAIDKFARIPSHRLGLYIPLISKYDRIKNLPTSLEEYKLIETIVSKFDLTSVAMELGSLYAAFFNYYERNIGETSFFGMPFSALHVGQKIHLCILLILYMSDISCPGLWQGSSTIVDDDMIVKVTDHIRTAQAELIGPKEKAEKLRQDILSFCQNKKMASYSDTRDDFSLFNHRWTHIENILDNLYKKMKVNKLNETVRNELSAGIDNIYCIIEEAKTTLSAYHTNQKMF